MIKKDKSKFFNIIVINSLIFAFLIILVEFFSVTLRAINGKEFKGFIYNNQSLNELKDNCLRMTTHPMLSHVHDHDNNCKIEGAKVNGQWVIYDSDEKQKDIILTLGGSTTDGFYFQEGYSWPKALNFYIKKNNKDYQVWNGGVGSYESSQELIKLITELPRFERYPKFVISLNGINENPRRGKLYNYPLFRRVNLSIFRDKKYINQNENNSPFFPSTMSLLRSFNMNYVKKPVDLKINIKKIEDWEKSIYLKVGEKDGISNIDLWAYNVQQMHSIVTGLGSKYFVFLQPTMGLENQIPQDLSSSDGKIYEESLRNNPENFEEMSRRYLLLKEKCKTMEYCIDISEAVPPTGNKYKDARHHNSLGNKELGKIIYETIFKDN